MDEAGKCTQCGKRDPMVPFFREKYEHVFEELHLALPAGICEECARRLWNEWILITDVI